jgi:hypothetical protein
MAVAAAGGGLLIAAAGAVPAYASAPAASAPRPGGHTITITAHRAAGAASGIGPHVILPCAVKPGVAPASCGQQTISCEITADAPSLDDGSGDIFLVASASTVCDQPVTEIDMDETLLTPLRDIPPVSKPSFGSGFDSTFIQAECKATNIVSNIATADITFPPGYVLTAGTNPIRDTSDPITVHARDCNPVIGGGGGGGGGCAIPAPSLAGHPAGRHPDLIICG